MRRAFLTSAIFTAILLATGCSGGGGVTMPNVVGKGLDVALDEVKRAGIKQDVKVTGGGMFGIVDKSNWKVCGQDPQSGAKVSSAPSFTVDRNCAKGGTAPSEPNQAPPQPAEQTSPASSPNATPETQQALTAANNSELAALLAVSEPGSAEVEAFAKKYKGKDIEFDGNIATMSNHGSNKTRYDILIAAGDYSTTRVKGPNFQFKDVNIVSDLHLTGADIPESLGKGQNLHIIATIDDYNPVQELFFLRPVSTKVR